MVATPDRPAHNRHGARDQQPPKIALTHLRYLAQSRLAAGRVLARYEAQPGREVATPLEALHRRREGLDRHRGDRPDPWHGHKPLHVLILPRSRMDLPLQVSDLPIETFNLLKQKATQRADRLRQVRDLILKRRRQAIDMDRPLGRNNAELRQMAAQRVDRLCALAHQKIACPEQHAPRLLLLRLHCHETHGRPRCRLADRLGVGRVVLLPLDVGFDINRRDQSHRMA